MPSSHSGFPSSLNHTSDRRADSLRWTYIYIYAFSRRFYPKRLTITFRLYIFISTCVPWESNPQPVAQQTQCSTTEPHRNIDLNLKHGVFRGGNKTLSDVYSCSFRALSVYVKTIGSRRDVWDNTVICHDTLKSHKTIFIVWISFKITQFKSWDISVVTYSVFSAIVFFTAWEHVLCESGMYVGHSNSN